MKSPKDCSSMDEVRTEIDTLDKALIELLGKRWQFVDRMWELKREQAKQASVPWRNTEVISKVRTHAASCGIGWGIQYQDEKLQD